MDHVARVLLEHYYEAQPRAKASGLTSFISLFLSSQINLKYSYLGIFLFGLVYTPTHTNLLTSSRVHMKYTGSTHEVETQYVN